jgi:hypothetical protein
MSKAFIQQFEMGQFGGEFSAILLTWRETTGTDPVCSTE